MLSALCVTTTLLLAGDPPKKNSDTMRGLIKDAVATPSASDGGSNGLDISKMPFSPDSVKTIVLSFQPQIQGCYNETLADKTKAVEGKLVTSFIITPDGSVKKPSVNKKTSTLKDAHLHECVVAVLSAMTFPAPPDKKDQPVDFPFNLTTTAK